MATITGIFPDPSFPIVCDILREWRKVDGSWSAKNIPMNSRDFLHFKEINALTLNWTNRTSATSNGGWHYGPWNVKVTGVPTPVPLDQLIEGTKIRTNNKPFLKRVKKGDIVVSPYRNITCTIKYSNGGREISRGARQVHNHGTSSLVPHGFLAVPNLNLVMSNAAVCLGNPNHVITGVFNYFAVPITMTDDIIPTEAGFDPSVFKDLMDSLFSKLDDTVVSNAVMKNLSAANAATVDILTALAEMPETLVSAINGCKTILKIHKGARNREFRWINKAKAVKIQRDRDLEALEIELGRMTMRVKDIKEKQRLRREADRRAAQIKADTSKTLAEIADAIANVWLNFRYNITPNVILIEDCVKAYETFGELYKRWTETVNLEVKPPQFTGWETTGTFSVTLRSFIKRKFKQISDMSAVLRNFSFNIFKTAYELIPLSFVLDWVIPIGDLLSASLGGTPSEYEEACTLSCKVNGSSVLYRHISSGATAEVTMKGYERRVINPYDYCRLLFLPNIGVTRQFDAVALAWSILRGNTLRNL